MFSTGHTLTVIFYAKFEWVSRYTVNLQLSDLDDKRNVAVLDFEPEDIQEPEVSSLLEPVELPHHVVATTADHLVATAAHHVVATTAHHVVATAAHHVVATTADHAEEQMATAAKMDDSQFFKAMPTNIRQIFLSFSENTFFIKLANWDPSGSQLLFRI